MYIKVKVTPRSRVDSIDKISDDTYHVSVSVKAERNMANQRTKELLAHYFGIDLSKLRLISGHHHPSKIFDVIFDI